MEQFLSAINNSGTTVAVIFLIAAILYCAWRGTGLVRTLMITLPIAALLYTIFPYHDYFTELIPLQLSAWAPLLLFGLLATFTFLVLLRTFGTANGSSRPLHILITAIAFTAIIISLSYHVVVFADVLTLGPVLDNFFSSPKSFFWTLVLALLTLFMV